VTDCRILLQTPDGRHEIYATGAEAIRPLVELLGGRGFPLNTRCGGRGLCGGCEVELRAGELRRIIDGAAIHAGAATTVKSCQMRADGAWTELLVPARSLLRHKPVVVSEFRINIPWACDPLVPAVRLGAAVDIGTTTVALILCRLANGEVLAEASAFNAQIRFGEDVLTRIQYCETAATAVAQLQHAVVHETINPLLAEACMKAGVSPENVGVMTIAGNTTMLHLLAGVDPTPMGIYPFRAAFLEHRKYAPSEIGLSFGTEAAEVHLLPGPAAYIGADLAAGMVATGLIYDVGPSLLVDAGTNGEIVAKMGDRLIGCATAAGPAFEGAGLTSGTRAVRGAIERVRLQSDPLMATVGIIGDATQPIGICGSAYVDFLCEARRAGILQTNGRFTDAFGRRAGDHVHVDAEGRKLRLHPRGVSGPIWISERDVSQLLQAKGAIAAGIVTLLNVLGVTPREVKTLYLAGGFGLHLSSEHAIGCGLLPGFTIDQIQVVGNTSLGGAFLAMQDRALLGEMVSASKRVEVIELNLQPGFENAFIDHLSLP